MVLVMAHHREEDNLRAGLVYIIMASWVIALLLAFGLLAEAKVTTLSPRCSSHVPEPLVTAILVAWGLAFVPG